MAAVAPSGDLSRKRGRLGQRQIHPPTRTVPRRRPERCVRRRTAAAHRPRIGHPSGRGWRAHRPARRSLPSTSLAPRRHRRPCRTGRREDPRAAPAHGSTEVPARSPASRSPSPSNGDGEVLARTLNGRSPAAGTATASHNHFRRCPPPDDSARVRANADPGPASGRSIRPCGAPAHPTAPPRIPGRRRSQARAHSAVPPRSAHHQGQGLASLAERWPLRSIVVYWVPRGGARRSCSGSGADRTGPDRPRRPGRLP